MKLSDVLVRRETVKDALRTLPWIHSIDTRHTVGEGWQVVVRVAPGHLINMRHVVQERLELLGIDGIVEEFR